MPELQGRPDRLEQAPQKAQNVVGTLINIAAVLLGGGLGTALQSRLPVRIRDTVLHSLGLITMTLGIHLTMRTIVLQEMI